MSHSISAIVLAYGPEPYLVECIAALRASAPRPEIIVVDNEADPGQIAAVAALGVTVLRPGGNLGFAGGANHAAAAASGDVLAFVNSDAIVDPDALSLLAAELDDPQVGLVSASIRLADDPELLNSAGNPVNYLMFSWAGQFGAPAAPAGPVTAVASISGATFAARRETWSRLGGFDDAYFAYCEDVDLSIRVWQAGLAVHYVPAAVATHHYEFSRNERKAYLLERNRLMNLLTLPERRTRWLLLPVAVPIELGVLLAAAGDGWGRAKVAGWRWLWQHRAHLATRRRRVAAARVVPDRELRQVFRGHLDPPAGLGPTVPAFVSNFLAGYWRLAQRLI